MANKPGTAYNMVLGLMPLDATTLNLLLIVKLMIHLAMRLVLHFSEGIYSVQRAHHGLIQAPVREIDSSTRFDCCVLL